MDYAAFKVAIYALCQDVFSEIATNPTAVIWAPQSTPRAAKPYVTLYPISPTIIDKGINWASKDNSGNYHSQGQRKTVISVKAFGLDAISMLTQFQESMFTQDVLNEFYSAGIAALEFSSVRDISELIDTAYETRAQCDVVFGWISDSTTSDVDVKDVEIKGTAKDAEGNTVYQNDVIVTS